MAALADRVQNTLDECRMLILGGQVLISFSAQSVLQPGFRELSEAGRLACGLAMVAQVAAVSLLMWPAAYHRIVCGGEDEPRLVAFAMRALAWGLTPFAIGLGASFYVVGERVGNDALATATGLTAAVAAIVAWYVFPYAAGRRAPPSGVILEEVLDLFEQARIEVLQLVRVAVAKADLGHRDQAVVADDLAPLLALPGLEHAEQAASDQTAGKRRGIHQHQDVERISILSLRRGHEAEVVREHRARGQDLAEREETVLGVELDLAVRALDCLDDDVQRAGLRVEGREPDQRAPMRSIGSEHARGIVSQACAPCR